MASNPLTINAGDEDVITLKADVAAYPSAVPGSYITFGWATTTYQGETGNPTTVAPAYRVAGNPQYIYKTKPTVTLATQSGTTLTNGEIDLLKFTVAADSKAEVNLYAINLSVALLDVATSTNLYIEDITLYEDGYSTALNDTTATSTNSSTYTTSEVSASYFGYHTTNNSETGDIKLYNNSGSALKTIGAGSPVTFVVKATVAGAASVGDSVTARLKDLSSSTKNAIVWGDGVSTNIDSSYVKTLPTGTWSYSIK
jgi:hypothetical protein